MKMISVVAIGLSLSVMHGCATLNEAECTKADWHDIGLKDGSAGERIEQFSRYQKACSKHGLDVDVESYNAGRNKGLISFCTADKGYKEGIYGNEYFGICPKPLASEFKTAYVKGLKVKLEQLSLEQIRLDQDIVVSRFEQTHISGGSTTTTNHLQNRMRSLQNVSQVIQGWIEKWPAP